MELYIIIQDVHKVLKAQGITASRTIVGNLMSSLEMPGMSISILPDVDEAILSKLDFPTSAPAWPFVLGARTNEGSVQSVKQVPTIVENQQESKIGENFIKITEEICNVIIANADYLTDLDRAAGDGDLGVSMTRGASAVLQKIKYFANDSAASFIHSLALCLQEFLAGTSGPLYSIFFLKLAAHLKSLPNPIEFKDWVDAIQVILSSCF